MTTNSVFNRKEWEAEMGLQNVTVVYLDHGEAEPDSNRPVTKTGATRMVCDNLPMEQLKTLNN